MVKNRERSISTESVKDIIKALDEEQKLEILEYLKREVNLYEIKGKRIVSEYALPISSFKQGLSGLETVCVYLKEEKNLRFSEIAERLNRSPVTARISYRNARKKKKERLDTSDKSIRIPIEIFKDRERSVLSHVARYLKDSHNIPYKEIALLLDRDYKTIWTAYKRKKKKRKQR